MRVLLDENLPHDLIAALTGHDVSTVQGRGWAGVENGELLSRAGFKTCFRSYLMFLRRWFVSSRGGWSRLVPDKQWTAARSSEDALTLEERTR